MINDEHALTERLDIIHVVCGQQDRHSSRGVDHQEKLANACPGYYIQTDGWLIQVQEFRVVE